MPEFSLEGTNKRRSVENDQENICARVRNDLWRASWTRGRRGSGGLPSGAFRALGCQTQDFTLDRVLSSERQAETRKLNYMSTSYLGRVERQPASQPAVFRVAGVENLILELWCLVESCGYILSLRFEVQRSPETLTAKRASSKTVAAFSLCRLSLVTGFSRYGLSLITGFSCYGLFPLSGFSRCGLSPLRLFPCYLRTFSVVGFPPLRGFPRCGLFLVTGFRHD